MRRLVRGLRQALPEIQAVQHLLNLHSRYELHARRVLPQPAMSHFAHQTAVFKLDVHAGAGSEIPGANEAQAAFRDIQHAAGFMLPASSADGAHPDRQIRGVASVPAWRRLTIHRLIIGGSRKELHPI